MRILWLAPLPLALVPILAFATPRLSPAETTTPNRESKASVPARNVDRSPTDLALSRDGQFMVTANNSADTASLVDMATRKVVSEVNVGARPFAVALTPDGKRAIVTNSWGNSVTVLEVRASTLTPVKTIPVGDEPRGVTVSSDGSRAFVALAGEDSVRVLDLKTLTATGRWKVGWEPWHLALTSDGTRLAVGNTRSRTVSVVDTRTGENLQTVKTLGRNLRHIAMAPAGDWAYLPTISERGLGVSRNNIDRGWVVGNRLARIPMKDEGPREAITLDSSGNAVGDVDGCTISPDGKTIVLTAGGTHELLILRLADLPFIGYGGPGDHMEPEVLNDKERFRRIAIGGRPMSVTFTPDGKTLLVANYLSNAVQVVDFVSGKVEKEISLGGSDTPSLARRGEMIFQDANRSFSSWYSCNSCHTEGHTNGGNFDTLNDGGFGQPKKTLSLRGVAETAPYTWHGWNKDLREAIQESMVSTMQGPKPSMEDVDAVVAYVKTLKHRPNPNRNPDGTLTASAKRGEAVFNAKACNTCHVAPMYSAPTAFKVGLEEVGDKYEGFNPPTLRGLYSRAPYLHDGRARTLEEVVTEYHRPSKLTGKSDCTPQELSDLVDFLKSL